jgi:hypothetical protein
MTVTGSIWFTNLHKGVMERSWEDLVLAVVGDQFDGCTSGRVAKSSPSILPKTRLSCTVINNLMQ